jgi:AbrB family looped-hinge helix DNA binding protein
MELENITMTAVTISPKYQVVIPQKVRESLQLRPGQKVQVVQYEGRVELVPLRSMKEMRGFVRGININFDREQDRL